MNFGVLFLALTLALPAVAVLELATGPYLGLAWIISNFLVAIDHE